MSIKNILLAIFVLVNLACSQKVAEQNDNFEASNLSGKELAKIQCGSCHIFPEPQLLPKNIWLNNVLPKMALRLGFGNYMNEMMQYSSEELDAVIRSNTFSEKPKMAKEDWMKIVKYYQDNAPETLEIKLPNHAENLSNFEVKQQKFYNSVVLTQFLDNKLWVGMSDGNVYNYGYKNPKIDSFHLKSPVVEILNNQNKENLFLQIGILNPSELVNGQLSTQTKGLIDKLHRPVNVVMGDVNEDGVEDYIISNFGNLTGNLSWFDGKSLKENVLSSNPGARVGYVVDFDQDGKKDIISLMTQGREAVVFHKNLGKGNFEAKNLLEFPPLYGSSYLELLDWDRDGDLDLIYTNGDNADFSITFKPYHGIRVLENLGHLKFKEKYFYPINGASKVLAKDFDQDGDIDLAVISFFPNKILNEGFLYFEQIAKNEFKVKNLKQISNKKWLTMDTGDFDKDGDEDIILGTFANFNQMKKENSVTVLENKLK